MAKRLIKSNAIQPSYGGESLKAVQKAITVIKVLKAERKAAAIARAEIIKQEGIDRLKNRVEKLVNKHGNPQCEHLNYQRSLELFNAPY